MIKWIKETWQEVKRQWNKPSKQNSNKSDDYLLAFAIFIILAIILSGSSKNE